MKSQEIEKKTRKSIEIQRNPWKSQEILGNPGKNNRNLENFETDIKNSIKIKKNIPDDILVISESGINNTEDIIHLGDHNINNFLIGESLMRSDNISVELNKLVNKE